VVTTFLERQTSLLSLSSTRRSGVQGAPRAILRFEALLELVLAVAIFAQVSGQWSVFAAAFLAPDIAFVFYACGKRAGALAYNITHSYAGPMLLGGLSFGFLPAGLPFALIWAAHIAFDRALGYGLKYRTGFADTHLSTSI
jgi:hypothetical protein